MSTNNDLTSSTIRAIVKDEIAQSEERMTGKVRESEERTIGKVQAVVKEEVSQSEERMRKVVKGEVSQSEERMTAKIDEVGRDVKEVGMDTTYIKTAFLQHVQDDRAWKHGA